MDNLGRLDGRSQLAQWPVSVGTVANLSWSARWPVCLGLHGGQSVLGGTVAGLGSLDG
jgi:hypothetical protein